jgi:ABC-type phosphate transport system substrate-binding protein
MKILIVILSLLGVSYSAFAEVAVVVHPNNSNALDELSISLIFLGKAKSFPDGSRAKPVNQKEDAAITDDFNKKLLNKSSAQLKAYWSKLVFTGKGIPPEAVLSDTEVIKLVVSDPNAIGYVDVSAIDDTVKVVFKH